MPQRLVEELQIELLLHADVGHVGPRHPAQPADDAGLRRARGVRQRSPNPGAH